MLSQIREHALVTTMSRDELLGAIQENLNAAVRSLASPQIFIRSTPLVTQSWSSVSFPYFNIVAQADVKNAADVAAVLAPYRTHRSTAVCFQISTSPTTVANDLLLRHGLTLLDVRRCMAVEIGAVEETETAVPITQVQNEAQCWDWVRVQSAANGDFPPVVQQTYVEMMLAGAERPLAFVAYDEAHQPVACSLLHLGGGVAGIYQVATAPGARRQGFGRSITNAALKHAAQLGYKISVLIATKMGGSVYEKMGFQDFSWAKVYLFSPEKPEKLL